MLTANRQESWRLTGTDISKAVSVMVYDSQYFCLFLVGYGWGETSMFMQRWCRINLDHLLHMHLWQYFKISSWCIYPTQSHMAKVIVTCIHLLDTYETIIHVFRSNQFNTNGCWCPGPPHRQDNSSHDIDCVRRCWQIHRPDCPGSQDIVDVRKLPRSVSVKIGHLTSTLKEFLI